MHFSKVGTEGKHFSFKYSWDFFKIDNPTSSPALHSDWHVVWWWKRRKRFELSYQSFFFIHFVSFYSYLLASLQILYPDFKWGHLEHFPTLFPLDTSGQMSSFETYLTLTGPLKTTLLVNSNTQWQIGTQDICDKWEMATHKMQQDREKLNKLQDLSCIVKIVCRVLVP